MINAETGRPLTYHAACWRRGVTVGYDPRAYADALAGVKAFLTTTIAARRRALAAWWWWIDWAPAAQHGNIVHPSKTRRIRGDRAIARTNGDLMILAELVDASRVGVERRFRRKEERSSSF